MAIWQWFQPAANNIKSWKFPPEINANLEALSKKLPNKISQLLIDIVTRMVGGGYKRYGKEFVARTIEQAIEFLKCVISGLGK